MTVAEIDPGICGFNCIVEVQAEQSSCSVSIKSDCPGIQSLSDELREVNPFEQISYRDGIPIVMALAAKHCSHTACPVPAGIVKAIEVEVRLALPADSHIRLSKIEDQIA